ncbi:DUF7010 family protein [Sphingomicrobium flavum]|uniref:DUF7010 family protein n=1 Tax=Sphingomicrobium flavum TaxID=1229164 RepID=UPI0021AD5240|nr:hypothetical protein [Sphingomicrobium flavum]
MTDYAKMPLAEARRDYLEHSTAAMPVGGLISWGVFALLLLTMADRLPWWAALTVGAIPVPIALMIDKARGNMKAWSGGNDNPIAKLFFRSIALVGFMVPLVIAAYQQSGDLHLLILGMAILSGSVWVPHGWGADDPAGLRHFVLRALLCYAVYMMMDPPLRGAAIAGMTALTYVYAIIAMKKPASA